MKLPLIICGLLSIQTAFLHGADSLPPLADGKVPTNLQELWGQYDPRLDPLDTQIVRQWTVDNITLRYVRFRIGTFKGKHSYLAGFYAFPPSPEKLPAILQIHGGGQRAEIREALGRAQAGYACLSINWGGRKMEDARDEDPNTDWGALDATQQGHNDHYGSMKPDAKTLDSVVSPRNNNWFLLVLAARRGLTFLEQQPEIDARRLGATGHSMGGKITTDLAGIDERVKAAVPSCGGAGAVSGKLSGMPGTGLKVAADELEGNTIDDTPYIPRITCPILYLAPTNDFAGPFDNMTMNWKNIGSKEVAYSIAPHFNHRHMPETGICSLLWFDAHLKGLGKFPMTPDLQVTLKGDAGIPRAMVKPANAAQVSNVEIYYSVDSHCLTRFWRSTEVHREGDSWVATCPVMSTEQPLYVFANVSYTMPEETKKRHNKPLPETFVVSSREAIYLPKDLQETGVKATDHSERMIEDFSHPWRDWFRLEWQNPNCWEATTRKIKDPKWQGPQGAALVLDAKYAFDTVLVVKADLNGWNAFPGSPGGAFEARKPIKGSTQWQTIRVEIGDMVPLKPKTPGKTAPTRMSSWDTVTELTLRWSQTYFQDGQEVRFGLPSGPQNGWNAPREFRNLHWEGGVYKSNPVHGGARTDVKPQNLEETIQKNIQKSLE